MTAQSAPTDATGQPRLDTPWRRLTRIAEHPASAATGAAIVLTAGLVFLDTGAARSWLIAATVSLVAAQMLLDTAERRVTGAVTGLLVAAAHLTLTLATAVAAVIGVVGVIKGSDLAVCFYVVGTASLCLDAIAGYSKASRTRVSPATEGPDAP